VRLHFRAELAADERRTFDRHASLCRECAALLLETERLDDLLLAWKAPDPREAPLAGAADDSFAERVARTLRGDGPTASCSETVASLHHFVAGDLEPWLAARVERHLGRCGECADHLDEVRHSRKVWLSWEAPDPSACFADGVVARLEPETRSARRRRQVVELLFGPMRVPRAIAALVLTTITLLSVGVLQMHGTFAPSHAPANVHRGDLAVQPVANDRFQLPVVTTSYATPVGRSDPTGSLSPELFGGRDGSLRATLRGERSDDSSRGERSDDSSRGERSDDSSRGERSDDSSRGERGDDSSHAEPKGDR
jgi:anti-sigma factor RsiW